MFLSSLSLYTGFIDFFYLLLNFSSMLPSDCIHKFSLISFNWDAISVNLCNVHNYNHDRTYSYKHYSSKMSDSS